VHALVRPITELLIGASGLRFVDDTPRFLLKIAIRKHLPHPACMAQQLQKRK
jgi:hypothetical protein